MINPHSVTDHEDDVFYLVILPVLTLNKSGIVSGFLMLSKRQLLADSALYGCNVIV